MSNETESDSTAVQRPADGGWFSHMLCGAGGHRYVVERRMNPGSRKVGCTRCGRHWAMHDATQTFIPWDDEIEAMYAPGGPLEPLPTASGNDADARCDETEKSRTP